MIQTSARPWTNSSESRMSPIAMSVAIMSGRLRMRSTASPNTGAMRPGAASTKNTSPAAAVDPVSVITHTLSARYMARSPNSESDWPTSSGRALRSASRARTSVPGLAGRQREARGQHLHRYRASGAHRGVDPVGERQEELGDHAADLGELVLRQGEQAIRPGDRAPAGP